MHIPTGELAVILSDINAIMVACKQVDPAAIAPTDEATGLPTLTTCAGSAG
jgi:hypothetical protein